MESNWRWNVWDCGLGDSPFQLCARLNPDLGVFKWVARSYENTFWYLWYSPVPTPLYDGDFIRWSLIGPKSFPYGLSVLPD